MTIQVGSVSSIPALDDVPSASAAAHAGAAKGSSASGGSAVAAETGAATGHGVSASGGAASLSLSESASQPSSRVISPLDQALAAVYTTSVAGHNYLGTVQKTAGEYVASASDPPAPPITGVGSSIQAAENNLTVVIDEMA